VALETETLQFLEHQAESTRHDLRLLNAEHGLRLADEAGRVGYLGIGQVLGDLDGSDVGAQVIGIRRARDDDYGGKRRSSQASTTWADVAPRCSAGPVSSSWLVS
jgi:hypothetical protein